jgi:hypothetical protein
MATCLRLPKQNKTTKQKESSSGLSNKPCGLGPTAHLSIYTRTHRGRKDTGNLQPRKRTTTKATRRPSNPATRSSKRPKTDQNTSLNIFQSFSHVPASSTQASKHRGYSPFIAVFSSGVGHGASLDPGGCCCSSSLRASGRKAGHD